MKPFCYLSVAVLLLAVSSAHCSSFSSNNMKPSSRMSPAQSQQAPSIDEMSFEKLESMSMEKGSEMVDKMYHMSQMNHNLKPNFVPSPSNVPVHISKANGQQVTTTLNKLATTSQEQPNFGDEEVTIFITGMPSTNEEVQKANQKLVEAFFQRYNNKRQQPQKYNPTGEKRSQISSEEDSSEQQMQKPSTGNFMMIDLGSQLNNFKRFAQLDTEQTGALIASALMETMEKNDVADETMHIIAQGIAAHVAGAAGKEYTRRTGRKFRRITALDPSKVFAKDIQTLSGLSRGDAEFVDAIHTNVYGFGTHQRVGDVDFFPNGPSFSTPGAKNAIEASMRATRYFAESVHPGHERNFPAMAANSFKKFMNNDSNGRRANMGIDTEFDVKGDFILEVNPQSPFGKRTLNKQNSRSGMSNPWKNTFAADNE